tara:strand:+ start:256 stop:507 length:252 start_codon:yes stop_codon:yes gene_type:complete
MGKKSSGKNETSKGERRSSIGHKNKDQGVRLLNQLNALTKGKNVKIVLPNLIEKNGKQQPATIIRVNGREWLKRRENKKESAE